MHWERVQYSNDRQELVLAQNEIDQLAGKQGCETLNSNLHNKCALSGRGKGEWEVPKCHACFRVSWVSDSFELNIVRVSVYEKRDYLILIRRIDKCEANKQTNKDGFCVCWTFAISD